MVDKRVWLSFLAATTMGLVACGTQEQASDTKIVGGEEVADDQDDVRRKSTVALTTDVGRAGADSMLVEGHSFCTGTVIHERVIVTAAHCLQAFDPATQEKLDHLILENESDFKVYFDIEVKPTGTYIAAEQVIPHPDWDVPGTLNPSPASPPNDIGVIVLAEAIPSQAQVVTIADPAISLSEGDSTFLAGYGVTTSRNQNDTGILRQVETPFTGIDTGAKRFSVGDWFRGACAGDSGGPAYWDVGGELQLAGATSTGAEIAGFCLGLMNNYTDVRQYKDWIESFIP